MKSRNIKQKSEELAEKAEQAGNLEALIEKAEKADFYIQELLDEIGRFNISEPHGWLSQVIHDLKEALRKKLGVL
jgi:hypothetical protein|tara:strand:- start:698 stop:922 length:225 start_codon:yes stop_codon:yes gene_type:complete